MADVELFRELFAMFDVDGNTGLDFDEVTCVVKALGIEASEAEILDLINEADADASGTMNFNEFCTLLTRHIKYWMAKTWTEF